MDYIENDIFLYADDTSLLSISDDADIAAMDINADLCILQQWANTWDMSFNPHKTVFLQISKHNEEHAIPPIFLNGIRIQPVQSHTHLGITFANNMK